MITSQKKRTATAACVIALLSLSGAVAAQQEAKPTASAAKQEAKAAKQEATAVKQEATAVKHVSDAVAVVKKMHAEPRMKELLQQAKGVFIVPTYGRAALGVGASGGAGVLLVKGADGTWTGPAFYNLGGLNVGLQAGVAAGPIAMVLNNDKAVNQFMKKNNFSLNAQTGITVVNWTKMAQGTAGAGDVVAWAGTKGLFGDVATIGLDDIRFNQNLTNAYYHRTSSASDVVAGKVSNPQADPLKEALGASSASATK